MLGTNPIAIAFPAKDEPPIVIDMATSAVALGKVEMALRKGTSIPLGWGMDREGRGTTDPEDIIKGGMLLPLGSDRERGAQKCAQQPTSPDGAACSAGRRTAVSGWTHPVPVSAAKFPQALVAC